MFPAAAPTAASSPPPSEILAGLRHRVGTAVFLVAAFAGSLGGFELLHQRSAVTDAVRQPGGWLGAILVVAGSAVLHELIHALGWIAFARVPWRSVSVRRTWRVMGFIACTNTALPVSAYRLSTVLPAAILGGGSLITGLTVGNGMVVLWGLFFLIECYSDITVLLATSGLRAPAKVREYPDRLGCLVEPNNTPG